MLKTLKGARVLVDCDTGGLHLDMGDGQCKPIGASLDWNQNDSSAPDYVKNRTHYTEISTTPIVSKQDLTFANRTARFFTDDSTVRYDSSNCPLEVEVVFDEQKYRCVHVGNGRYGNTSLAGQTTGANNGEPFCVRLRWNTVQCWVADDMQTHSISISKFVENVHKLDVKYLPDGGVGYTEVVEESIAGAVYDIPIDLWSGGTQTHNLHIPLQLGQTWTITLAETFLGGTETCEVQQADDGTLCLRYCKSSSTAFLTFTADSVVAATWGDVQYLTGVTLKGVSGTMLNETIHKLDEKYMPDGVSAEAIADAQNKVNQIIVPAVKSSASTYDVTYEGLTVQIGTMITVIPDITIVGSDLKLSVNGGTYYPIQLSSLINIADNAAGNSNQNNDEPGGYLQAYMRAGKPTVLQFDGAAWRTVNVGRLSAANMTGMDIWAHSTYTLSAAEERVKTATYEWMHAGRIMVMKFTNGNTAEYPQLNVDAVARDIIDSAGNPIQTLEIPAGGYGVFMYMTSAGWLKLL